MISLAPIGASINASLASFAWGIESAASFAGTNFIPDRELRLTVSDNLQRQDWLYAGQRYTEKGSAIIVNENEQLRLILANDTNQAHSLVLDGVQMDLAARETRTVDLVIDQLQPKTLTSPAAGIAQTIKIRPSYQTHAMFEA